MDIDQTITQIARTMNVSEAYVAASINRIIDTPQPCYHHGPFQGLCKSTKCSECDVVKGKGEKDE